MPRPFGSLHIAFLAIFGVAGWALLIFQTLSPSPQPFFLPPRVGEELVGCLVLVGVGRALAFRVFERARIALDSVFYVAVRFAFGTIAAAWLMVVVLTIDGIVTHLRGAGPVPRGEAPLRHTLALIANMGGLPVLVLMLVSGAFGGDRRLSTLDDTTLLWLVPAFAVTFLAIFYFVAAGRTWFLGTPSSYLWRAFFMKVVGAELTLVPLALAMTLSYKHQGIGLFVLLGSTGLLLGAIFRRLANTSDDLRQRVAELQAINRIARIISDSYDQPTLFKNLSMASLQLVEQASLFMIGLVDPRGDTVSYELYDERGECLNRMVADRSAGLSGWVMTHRKPLRLDDLQRDYLKYAANDAYNDVRYHSWLGVPLTVSGEVVGVMSVQSERTHAYGPGHVWVLETIADQAAVAIENSRLYQLATVDGLTGLFVRRYFDQRLQEEWDRTQRYGNSFCLGMFDLDRFKELNDTFGHLVGDHVLREAARCVRENMRSFDVAARYGGEEFAFILPRTTLPEAAKVGERIRRDVARIEVPAGGGRVARVTASIGIAQCPGDGMMEASDLVARADHALYRAKSGGRNRVVLSDNIEGMTFMPSEAGGTI